VEGSPPFPDPNRKGKNMGTRTAKGILGIVVGTFICWPTFAQLTYHHVSVQCGGVHDDLSPAAFDYEVTIDNVGMPWPNFYNFSLFVVGTDCVDESHYSNWRQPDGWTHGFGLAEIHNDTVFTQHGGNSEPENLTWGAFVYWIAPWTDSGYQPLSDGTWDFGFASMHPAHDVSYNVCQDWILSSEWGMPRLLASTDILRGDYWDAPVGLGIGPVHGPSDIEEAAAIAALIPEPTPSALLTLAGLALLGLKRGTISLPESPRG
jgi:hypothetical protein